MKPKLKQWKLIIWFQHLFNARYLLKPTFWPFHSADFANTKYCFAFTNDFGFSWIAGRAVFIGLHFNRFLKFVFFVPFDVSSGFSFSSLLIDSANIFEFLFLHVFVNVLKFKENKPYESKIWIMPFFLKPVDQNWVFNPENQNSTAYAN